MYKSIEQIDIKPHSVLFPGNLNKKVGQRIFNVVEGLLGFVNTELYSEFDVFHGKVDDKMFRVVLWLMEKEKEWINKNK